MTTDGDYSQLGASIRSLLAAETDGIANAGNFVASLYHALEDVNWVGIYALRGDELVLGPFQGKPACVRIPLGRGVCGTAAATGTTQRVADVRKFAGHIVCDAASRSELVVPLTVGGRVLGVLDIDSPVKNRFSRSDQLGIESLCEIYCGLATGSKNFI